VKLQALPAAFFLLFASVAIVLSYWIGWAFWNPFLVGALSLGACYLLRGECVKNFSLPIPPLALCFAAIAAFLAIYPAVFVTPGYMGSADSMHITHLRLLTDRIPATYEPYSPLQLYYFLGFTFVAKIAATILPFISDNLILILLGGLFVGLQSVLVFLIGREIGKSEDAGIFAALLFTGTKFAFQNMYYGLFPWVLGTTLFLFLVLAALRKSRLAFIAFPAMALTHIAPVMYFASAAFFSLLLLRPKADIRGELPLWAGAFALAAPILPTYYAFFADGISMNSSGAMPLTFGFSMQGILVAGLFLGLGPLVVFAACLALWLRNPKLSAEHFLLLAVFFSGTAVFLVLGSSSVLFQKIQELSGIAAVLFCGLVISTIRFTSALHKNAAFALLLAFMIAGFFSSGTLHMLSEGSKITPQDAAFSFRFREAFPERARVLFVSPSSPTMAALSDKIPYNVLDGFFVSLVGKSFDPAYVAEQKKSALQEQIVHERCHSCIGAVDVKYIAAPKGFFSEPLQYPIVFEYGGYTVYQKPALAAQSQTAGG